MKTFFQILVIAVIVYFAYTGFNKTTSSKRGIVVSNSQTLHGKLPIKLFIAADATGSLNDNGVQELSEKQISRVINTLKTTGGQLGLLIINDNSARSPILRIAIQKQPVPPLFPVHGTSETSYYYGKRLQQYQQDRQKFITDSSNYSRISLPEMQEFLKKAKFLLVNAYAHLAQTSDCIGALNVSQKFQAEPTRYNTKMRHITVLISDMVNTGHVSQLDLQPIGNIEYYIVRTKRTKDCIPGEIKYDEFDNINACLDFIF